MKHDGGKLFIQTLKLKAIISQGAKVTLILYIDYVLVMFLNMFPV